MRHIKSSFRIWKIFKAFFIICCNILCEESHMHLHKIAKKNNEEIFIHEVILDLLSSKVKILSKNKKQQPSAATCFFKKLFSIVHWFTFFFLHHFFDHIGELSQR